MKARIKDTGEIIDVKFGLHPNPAVVETYWWCKDKQECYHKRELDFLDVDMVMNKPIDWEQRRYEIAKDIVANSFATPMENMSMVSYIHQCVNIAEILIDELKRR